MWRLALVGVLSACMVHVPIDRPQLERLDGYGKTDQPHPFMDRRGDEHLLDDKTPLYLVDRRGQRSGGAFKSVSVDTEKFSGELLDGSTLALQLSALDHGELERREVAGPLTLAL